MMRIPALFATTVLCLAGCFVFDNPYDTTPTATFQIIVSSVSYGGTYVWSPEDSAYEATVGGTRYYVYMDSTGYWCLASMLNQTHTAGSIAHSLNGYGALPPTSLSGWSGSIAGVDDSAGGVCPQGGAPDGTLSSGMTLKVVFLTSSPGNSATYQWQKSPTFAQSFDSPIPIGTGSTYQLKTGDYGHWYRVIITPTDSTGTIQGTSVASQPVGWP